MPAEAHGIASGCSCMPRRNGSQETIRSGGRGNRGLLYAHWPPLFWRRRDGARIARASPHRTDRIEVVGHVEHRMVLFGLRVDALVREGAGVTPPAVRPGRCGGFRFIENGGGNAGESSGDRKSV